MSTEDTTVLEIIRGLTEFLPLSSSGHLVIFQHLIWLRGLEPLLDIALHVGTLLAILMVFRADVTIYDHRKHELYQDSSSKGETHRTSAGITSCGPCFLDPAGYGSDSAAGSNP